MAEPATAFDPTDDNALSRAIAEARAQVKGGKTIPLDEVSRWLDSWGQADERPPPSCE